MKFKKPLIRFIPMDSTRNILINYSAPILVFVANCMLLPMALSFAYLMYKPIVFVFLFIGLLLATAFLLIQGVNPFQGGILAGGKVWNLPDLDESALRILTFFKSKEAQTIVLRIAVILFGIIPLAWYMITFVIPKWTHSELVREGESLWTGSFIAGFFFFMCALGNYLTTLTRRALKHWDRIQVQYPPWPVNRPYYYSFRDLLKWIGRQIKR